MMHKTNKNRMLDLIMKQILFVTFSFLSSQVIFGQSGTQTNSLSTPNQIPPTPETYKFTKYGDIPVNESSGNATVDIPLYIFKGGKIAVPISITHSGGAVRVDEITTWTGINWQLNVGGLISRTVNDLPDENCNSTERKLLSMDDINYLDVFELQILASDNIDTEVDIFNYNFGGYSGSFYLDKDTFTPRLIKYDKELKIELSANPTINGILKTNLRTITITTTDGTKYYFGGENASESTRMASNQLVNFTVYGQTGFYLYKIESFNGDIVTFNYTSSGPSTEVVGKSSILKKDIYADPSYSCQPTLGVHTFPQTDSTIESLGKLKLYSIESNRDSSKVIFNTTLQSSNNLHKFVLNNISVFSKYIDSNNAGNIIHKKIAFEYLLPNNGTYDKRFFLEKIKIYEGANTITDNVHSFEYNSPNLLPERFSYSQDYLGYYNGKNNLTLIPKVDDPFFNGMTGVNLADRSVVFETTVFGSLKKVIYPTKGFTEFEYETGIDNTKSEYKTENRYLNIYLNDPASNGGSHASDEEYTTGIIDDNVGIQPTILNPSQPISVNISATVNGSVTNHHFIKFTLDDTNSTSYDQTLLINLLNSNGGQKEHYLNHVFNNLNPSGNYKFKLEYYSNSTGPGDAPPTYLMCTAQVTFGTNVTITNYKPGIRIKRTKNYTDIDSQPLISRYYYNRAVGRLKATDSELVVSKPIFISNSKAVGSCLDQSGLGYWPCMPYTIYSKNIHSETQNNVYISDNNRSVYQYVTVSYGGDEFENGGKESHFFVQADLPLSSVTSDENFVSIKKGSNNSLKNGTLLKEIYFSANPTFNLLTKEIITGKVKEITNTYIPMADKDKDIISCYVQKYSDLPICMAINPSIINNVYLGYYYTFSWWYCLGKTETKEYLENGIIESYVNYFYDSKLAGMPSRVVSGVNALNTDVYETRFSYPPDISTNPNINTLTNQYRIGEPVVVKKFKNGELLDTQNTIYHSDDSNAPILILPAVIQTSKGDNVLEDRIIYHQYDSKGNPVEISQKNGSHTMYIWGYHQTVPIAKMENISYDILSSEEVINLQSLSNTSDEASLLLALNSLRSNYPNSLVTTYTYKPLVGISTITDPKGDKVTYNYDQNNRLEFIKDNDGNIISENKYNFRP